MTTKAPPFVILYVTDPEKSALFYEKLLSIKPVQSTPTFVLFALPTLQLGLWKKSDVEPAVALEGHSFELGFAQETATEIDKLFTRLKNQGITIAQEPTTMNFGRTFVALDPDEHRIRFFAETS